MALAPHSPPSGPGARRAFSPHAIPTATLKIQNTLRFALLALLGTSSLASADTVTGRVVDANGVGVNGVNIDAIRVSNGNDENIANDGTNATGDFTSTIQAGVYDFIFYPPAPPATSHVAKVVRNVVVAGTKNLGTITLEAGSLLSGRTLNPSAVPVAQVTLQLFEDATGLEVPIAVHRTDAFGNFNLAVPKRALELRLITTSVPLQTLVSQKINTTPLVNTNLGNLTLAQGFLVTGTVQRASNSTAVAGINLDVKNSLTGATIYTPNDNSNALGAFSLVVPAGTLDFELCAPTALRLVSKGLRDRVITGSTSLGVIALESGYLLSGIVRSSSGVAQVNADVDVRKNGLPVTLCGDNSSATGAYGVVVPAGTLKVTFHPPSFNLGLGNDIHKNLLISGDTVLDGSLPACNPPTNYGTGLAGTGGFVPHLTSSGGVPAAGNTAFGLELQNGRGGATAFLMISGGQNAQPAFGGTLLVVGDPCCSVFFPVALGGTLGVGGTGSAHFTLPFDLGRAAGFTLYAQYFVQDSGAAQGWAMSEGLRIPVCR